MDELLKCFADPVRIRILHLLANRGPAICVCDLVELLNLPQGTVSRHLTRLRHLGVVEDRRQGTWIFYSLAKPGSSFHRGLIKCLRTCCEDEPHLQEDLEMFDRLVKKGCLACCTPVAVKPFNNSGRKTKTTSGKATVK